MTVESRSSGGTGPSAAARVTPPAGAVVLPTLVRKETNLWKDAFYRLRRNRAAVIGGAIILVLLVTYVFAPQIARRSYEVQVNTDNNAMPQWLLTLFPSTAGYAKVNNFYLFGADDLGRDVFSRVVYGTRISLTVALIGPLIALLIGTIYGSISGYFGGRLDNLMMRLVDVLYSLPSIIFVIVLITTLEAALKKAVQAASGTTPALADTVTQQFLDNLSPRMFDLVGGRYYLVPQVLPVDAKSEAADLNDPFMIHPIEQPLVFLPTEATGIEVESAMALSESRTTLWSSISSGNRSDRNFCKPATMVVGSGTVLI